MSDSLPDLILHLGHGDLGEVGADGDATPAVDVMGDSTECYSLALASRTIQIPSLGTYFRQLIQQHEPERDLYLESASRLVLGVTKMN